MPTPCSVISRSAIPARRHSRWRRRRVSSSSSKPSSSPACRPGSGTPPTTTRRRGAWHASPRPSAAPTDHPTEMEDLAFIVLAPQARLDDGIFEWDLALDAIRRKVRRRVEDYAGERDAWFRDWFEPTWRRIEVRSLSWEDLIDVDRVPQHCRRTHHRQLLWPVPAVQSAAGARTAPAGAVPGPAASGELPPTAGVVGGLVREFSGRCLSGSGFSGGHWHHRDERRRRRRRWRIAGAGGRGRFDLCPPGRGPGSRRVPATSGCPERRPGGIARPGRGGRSGNGPNRAWRGCRATRGFCRALASAS